MQDVYSNDIVINTQYQNNFNSSLNWASILFRKGNHSEVEYVKMKNDDDQE